MKTLTAKIKAFNKSLDTRAQDNLTGAMDSFLLAGFLFCFTILLGQGIQFVGHAEILQSNLASIFALLLGGLNVWSGILRIRKYRKLKKAKQETVNAIPDMSSV